MISSTIFPGKYIQGNGAIQILGSETSKLGKVAFLISSPPHVFDKRFPGVRDELSKVVTLIAGQFGGECSEEEISRLSGLASSEQCDVVIGMGGGKTLDTAKAAACGLELPVIMVPTIASNDAPCSALSVIHSSQGEFERLMLLPRNPDVVLVDTEIIVKSPVRFFIAGMGDALSTSFEAESCQTKCARNLNGHFGSMMAHEISHLSYKILLEYGLMAKKACEEKRVIPAVELLVEAIVLLSGVGHENCNAAAAHAINNGFNVLPETRTSLHGEKVAFGTLASLFLTNKPEDVIDQVYSFCESVGLPTTLSEIGLSDVSDENIFKVAEATCASGTSIYNEPVPISNDIVFTAITAADFEGRRRKRL
ncbi:MAG: glycerol dehydrogenase [Syntrophaceae bacterium]|nr:glycerol dehydrogenase [Syntrophaceae bacterium]